MVDKLCNVFFFTNWDIIQPRREYNVNHDNLNVHYHRYYNSLIKV